MHTQRKLILATPFIFICFIFLSYSTAAQKNLLNAHAAALKQMIETQHIEPRKMDPQFSSLWFNQFIENIDQNKLYFTKADIKILEKFRYSLHEDFSTPKWEFFNASTQLFQQKLKAAEKLIETICSRPFEFNTSQTYNSSLDTAWADSEKQWTEKWQYALKKEVLELMMNTAASQFITSGKINRADVLSKESVFRNKVKTKYLAYIKYLKGDAENVELATLYLNAFLECHDPHSSFMDADEKKNFESSLDIEALILGLSVVDNEKGEVVIKHLWPGSSAWMSGVLHKDDILIQLKWSDKEPIDLTGLSAEEVSAFLDEAKGDKIELTVRKPNGQKETAVLQKRKMETEENTVKGYVLKGEKNIGYITLPSFYTEWEESGGSRCAADVAKEIVKLKKDNISGLIIDLRYNGGGSLMEAVEMAGIFIDEGAMTQVKSREEKPMIMKDMNRGVIYSGPLVVLVNGQSASASELLAATLQDYNRALIVGSRTYGKGTGQVIVPVEKRSNATVVKHSSEGDAYVKLTTIKTFRTTGKSVQRFGVQPDIELPDFFDEFTPKENNYSFALTVDELQPYKYFKPLTSLETAILKTESAKRISSNQKFRELKKIAASLKASIEKRNTLLKWEDAEKLVEKEMKEQKLVKGDAFAPSAFFTPSSGSMDAKFTASNEVLKEYNKYWLEKLSKDLYVEESYLILLDLIKLSSK